jgi:hypothetical protein
MTDLVEMDFRDGTRWVPKYIAKKMEGIEETALMTYEDAVHLADRMELEGFVKRAQEKLIAGHFRVNRYG